MARQSPFMSAQYAYPSSYQQRDARYPPGSSVESAMALNRRPSLLAGYQNHLTTPERTALAPYYHLPLAPVSMGPHVDEHSKRSRYPTGANLPVTSQLPPLSIDIKKEQQQQQVYQPQTEAISPTPDEPKIDSNLRDSTIIRNSISKLESEIDITMKKLQRAKLSQSEIKSQADKSAADDEENDDRDDLLRSNGSQTLIEKILHDNRKKGEDSQRVFHHLNNNLDLTIPLYEEPNDLQTIQNIRTKYLKTMKHRLQEYFKRTHEIYIRRIKDDSNKYDQLYKEWQKSIEKDERIINSKDVSTYRDIFEKTFPELRKLREDKDKKQTTNAENSSADSTSSMTNNTNVDQEFESEDDKMRKSSIIPPIMYDDRQRKHQYFNQNGLIRDDAAEFYKERTKMPHWTNEEKQIFTEKFTQSPKNFGFISSFLETKTTGECIQFYYMTKKTENYKNLLRKQSQANKRKAKQNTTTTTTTTTVTSSTTIETTVVTKVTSSNTIVSQILGSNVAAIGQENDRTENDEDRRETNSIDGNEEKRANKNRCQLLSCTTGRKKNRKNRLRAFPNKWNELTLENRDVIRRSLQIPQNVQRCCTRCYEKLIIQVRQYENTNQTIEEEEDDDDDESSKMISTQVDQTSDKGDDEWTKDDIEAFTEALQKYADDWRQISEYVHRSEQSCRAFYLKYRKKNGEMNDENNIDEDNGSISGSEETSRRLTIPIKEHQTETIDEDNDDDGRKLTTVNEESNDSPHGMVIDEGDEQTTTIEEKIDNRNSTTNNPILLNSNFTTINSLVEKEISKTLAEPEKKISIGTNLSPDKTPSIPMPVTSMTSSHSSQPPPLVTLTRPQSPPVSSHKPSTPNQSPYVNKGSIMRGTPISSSISPANKPISIDTSIGVPSHPPSHSHHPHHFPSPRNDYPSHHPSNYLDPTHMKSSKGSDRSHEQQLYLQQHQAAYMRHYNYPPASNQSNFQSSGQYLQQQQQQQQQHKLSTVSTTPKSMPIDPNNSDLYETLRADYLTSRYLTTTHSPGHERPSRHPSEQRSPSQSSSMSNNPTLLPPPTAIGPSPSNPTHPSQSQQAALLAASQLLASSGMYPQELLANSLLSYSSYYGSLPGAQFLLDPRLMHELAAVNNEQLKNLRATRHPATHGSTHSPPDRPPSSSPYPNPAAAKRHSHENLEQHMRYAANDYPGSIWRAQNMPNPQLKSNPTGNENPLLKLNELSRHSARVATTMERDARSPEDFHLRINQSSSSSRVPSESQSANFARNDPHSHHKSSSHDKLNPTLHHPDHPSENNPSLSYFRQGANVPKSQSSHHLPQQHYHPHHSSNSSNRSSLTATSQISPSHASTYMLHGHHHSPVGAISPQQQQQQQQASPHPSQSHIPQQHKQSSHHHESLRNPKESISIQDFIKHSVTVFVNGSNNDNKHLSGDLSNSENPAHPILRLHPPATFSASKPSDNNDQPILIDGDDDSNPPREQQYESNNDPNSKNLNKSNTMDNEIPQRRRDSSIKKILSNQPLEKKEYVEINQKVQNSSVGASKVHSSNDLNGLERTNSTGGREATRSRGSITMRMLMGANGIYADGKAQPMATNEPGSEASNKRAASPHDKGQSLEYLIRSELDRACPTIAKPEESSSSIFHTRHASNRSSPTPQTRPASNQSQPPTSKRMRTSPRDDGNSSSQESFNTSRDPFLLQTHSKNPHHPAPPPSSTASATAAHLDRNWQSYVQQQYHLSATLGSRSSRPMNMPSGSITQGSPISPSMRSATESSQYPSASNNQLMHPRYTCYMNKNEPQHSPSGQMHHDHSPKARFARRSQQTLPSPSDYSHESSLNVNTDHSSNLKSSPTGHPMQSNVSGNTPPTISSPVSSSASPTTSVSSNSAHPLKKRLISEYEFEQQQQQRHSPTIISPVTSTATATARSATSEHHIEDISDTETTKETNASRQTDTDSSS